MPDGHPFFMGVAKGIIEVDKQVVVKHAAKVQNILHSSLFILHFFVPLQRNHDENEKTYHNHSNYHDDELMQWTNARAGGETRHPGEPLLRGQRAEARSGGR